MFVQQQDYLGHVNGHVDEMYGGHRRNQMTFVIAHRLSTIRQADLILAMNDGDIVEQGAHAELLARGGCYATLYNTQLEDGRVAEAAADAPGG